MYCFTLVNKLYLLTYLLIIKVDKKSPNWYNLEAKLVKLHYRSHNFMTFWQFFMFKEFSMAIFNVF